MVKHLRRNLQREPKSLADIKETYWFALMFVDPMLYE